MRRTAKIVVAASLVLALVWLSGCTRGGTGSGATGGTSGPRRGGVVVVPLQHDLANFNSALSEVAMEQIVGSKIFTGLVAWDDQFRPTPDLAESWEIKDNGLTYVFRLRKGVKWHDGKPFSSADVLFTYKEVLSKYKPITTDLFKDVVVGFEAPDANTFVIKLKSPQPALLTLIQGRDAPIIPKHLYEGTDILKNPANQKPIGTGPFKFKSRQAGSEITLVRNDNYYKKGRPFLDGIVFRVQPDANIGSMGFEKGEFHYLPSVYAPREAIVRMLGKPGLVRLENQNPPSMINLFFNVVDGRNVNNPKVRQAISVALDRKQIVDLGQSGYGSPAVSALPSEYVWAVNPAVKKWYTYDAALAEKMLDEAGLKKGANGMRFKLRFIYEVSNINIVKPAEVIKAQLAKVGIDVELVPLERALLLDNAFNKYNFDMFSHNYATQGDPALGIARTYVSTSIQKGQNFNNVSRYANKRVDELWALGASSSDVATRAKAYFEVQEIIANDMPTAALFTRTDVGLGSDKFVGLGWRPDRTSWDWVWSTSGKEISANSYLQLEPDLLKRLQAGEK
jgi:peptide/nickel transport system substrate-binding protein